MKNWAIFAAVFLVMAIVYFGSKRESKEYGYPVPRDWQPPVKQEAKEPPTWRQITVFDAQGRPTTITVPGGVMAPASPVPMPVSPALPLTPIPAPKVPDGKFIPVPADPRMA